MRPRVAHDGGIRRESDLKLRRRLPPTRVLAVCELIVYAPASPDAFTPGVLSGAAGPGPYDLDRSGGSRRRLAASMRSRRPRSTRKPSSSRAYPGPATDPSRISRVPTTSR